MHIKVNGVNNCTWQLACLRIGLTAMEKCQSENMHSCKWKQIDNMQDHKRKVTVQGICATAKKK